MKIHRIKAWRFLVVLLFLNGFLHAQKSPLLAVDSVKQAKWVQEKYQAMSLEEKVGQLFIVATYSNRDETHYLEIENLVKNEAIGGLIFMQDQAEKQIELTNRYNQSAKIPLFIGMDAEWGLAQRLVNVERFPWAMTVGAVQDNALVKEMGQAIGEQVNRMGVHFNFAPAVDVNTNPLNPIIGNRSFGSNVDNVAAKGIAYMEGMLEKGVLASAKHFPGHGDTHADSHKTTPVVGHDLARLKAVELATFQKLIDAGVASVMVAHLNVPALDDSGLPSSISKKIITDVLKNDMNFQGLVITDALNMAGVANAYAPGVVDLMAFEAGNDILLFSQNVKKAKEKIIEKINSGEITEARLAESVQKILMAKYLVGLYQTPKLSAQNLMKDLNKVQYAKTTHALYEKAMTLVKNDNNFLPIRDLTSSKIAYVPLEEADYDYFHTCLEFQMPVDLVQVNSLKDIERLSAYDAVIVGLHKSNETAYKSYKISQKTKDLIQAIAKKQPTVLTLFGSPYGLMDLDLTDFSSVLVMYQNLKDTHAIAASAIFGGVDIQGKLPADINDQLKYGQGIHVKSLGRLALGMPKAVGMDDVVLKEIDGMALAAIQSKATPGMQILAARDGKVIYDQSFGYFDEKQSQLVDGNALYDLASVTKIAATLPLLMQEVDAGEMNLDQTLGSLLPKTTHTDKGNLTLKEILAHQSGLPPWIGFYKESVNVQNARLYLDYYSRKQDETHGIKVTDNIYIINSIKDTIMTDILYAPLSGKKYAYSDLGYYLFQNYLEEKYQKPLNELVQEKIYAPMQMQTTTYLPKEQFPLAQIVPTTYDRIYRNQLLRGDVQDEGAAMMGGVAGHAGLFSSAKDLAKLMQMYLNGGQYGGAQFFKSATLEQFTQKQFAGNHRGAGFDKLASVDKKGPSANSYGHYGFTGTMVWNDPDQQLVFVLLTNRVHPSVDNNLLQKNKIRENIRQKVYDAIVL